MDDRDGRQEREGEQSGQFDDDDKIVYAHKHPLVSRVECSPMAQEIGVQSQVESYQRLKKNGTWYRLA